MFNINYELFSPLSLRIEPVTTSLGASFLQTDVHVPYVTDSYPAFALNNLIVQYLVKPEVLQSPDARLS